MTNVHPLDDVRGLQEEHKGDWTAIVREHLMRTLLRTGYVSAEDFDALGVPAEHSNLPNAQMGSYSKLQYMEKVSWRRSPKPSRKGGTIWTHKLTALGRRELSKLAGVDAGSAPEQRTLGGTSEIRGDASVDSGENQRGRDRQVRGAGSDEDGSAPVVNPDRPSDKSRRNTQPARLSASSPETLSLFEVVA